MENFIVAGILVIILGVAILSIVRAKKSGIKCIGCPSAGHCAAKANCSNSESACGCHSDAN